MVLPFFTAGEILQVAQIEIQIAEQIARQAAGSRESIDRRIDEDATGLKALTGFDQWALVNPDGPMWFRGFATWAIDRGAAPMRDLLSRYNVAHFVVGHTPQKTAQITPRFDGAVFLIDTGMLASVYSGRASALEIADGHFTAVYSDGRVALTGAASGR
jgi:hypothetical protein